MEYAISKRDLIVELCKTLKCTEYSTDSRSIEELFKDTGEKMREMTDPEIVEMKKDVVKANEESIRAIKMLLGELGGVTFDKTVFNSAISKCGIFQKENFDYFEEAKLRNNLDAETLIIDSYFN